MTTCSHCGAGLESHWKFCVRCGHPVIAHFSTEQPPELNPTAEHFDDQFHDIEPARPRVDVPRAIGIAFAVAGVALIVWMAVVLGGYA